MSRFMRPGTGFPTTAFFLAFLSLIFQHFYDPPTGYFKSSLSTMTLTIDPSIQQKGVPVKEITEWVPLPLAWQSAPELSPLSRFLWSQPLPSGKPDPRDKDYADKLFTRQLRLSLAWLGYVRRYSIDNLSISLFHVPCLTRFDPNFSHRW